jgi:two-component system LytT family sensor kinase
MILGSVCIGFIVLLVQSVEGEKEARGAAGKTGARYR